jgi:hypothetical protein
MIDAFWNLARNRLLPSLSSHESILMIPVRFLQHGRRSAAILFSSAALLVVVGCSSAKVYPVSGQINFKGKPMAGTGSITFIPVVQKEGAPMAGGEVLADGTYKLTTVNANDGAMAGDYRVVISQVTSVEPKPAADGEAAPKVVGALTPDQLIPAIYADHAKSPLTATVKAEKNTINFDLPIK